MNGQAITRRIAFISFIGGLGGGLVFPIIPALGLQLGIPAFMVGLILSANRISRLVFNLPAGNLIGRLGPRVIMTAALGLEALGLVEFSIALHFGNAMWWLLSGRLVFGVGTSFLFVGGQAAVLSLSDYADRGRKTAVVRVAMSIAMPGGLVLGGILADVFNDDVAFLTGTGISLAGAVIAMTTLPPLSRSSDAARPRMNPFSGFSAFRTSPYAPVIAAACGFNALIFMTVQGALLATMVVLLARRHVEMFGMQAQGTSGLVMAVMVACSALVSLAVGRIIDAANTRTLLLVPSLIGLVTGFIMLAVAHSLWLVLLGTVFIGLSYNGVTLPLLALLGDVVGERQYGPVVGLYQLFGDIGGTAGPILGIEAAARIGLMPLYLIIATLAAVAILAGLRLRAYEMRVLVAARP